MTVRNFLHRMWLETACIEKPRSRFLRRQDVLETDTCVRSLVQSRKEVSRFPVQQEQVP